MIALKLTGGVNMIKRTWALLLICLSTVSLSSQQSNQSGIGQEKRQNNKSFTPFTNLSPHFIRNEGQLDKNVLFYLKGKGSIIYFTKEGLVFDYIKREKDEKEAKRLVFNLDFIRVNRDVKVEGGVKKKGTVNYFIGNNPAKWRTNIPTFDRIIYRQIYEGIDLVYGWHEGELKYEFVVAPGAYPERIRLTYRGVDSLRVDKDGDLIIGTPFGEIKDKKPYAYQEIDGGRIKVDASFVIGESEYSYGFGVKGYNPNYPLIIDPDLIYSTYLGGSGYDTPLALAVDNSGNVYVCGHTGSGADFPTKNPYRAINPTPFYVDAFVTKFNARGNDLIYSTYLGGSLDEYAHGISVDSSGNAYVAGNTESTDFPISNAYQAYLAGETDVFVTKFNADGSELIYSTYLGGGDYESYPNIVVDGSGNAYVVGDTESTNFPTKNPYQANNAGGNDAFLTKFTASGNDIVYSTYLGGSGNEGPYGYGIAVDSSGNAYITGYTNSIDFPTKDPFQANNAGGSDAFLTKFNATGSDIGYSTYLGGSGSEWAVQIAVDNSDNMYIAGSTVSIDFPTKAPYQASNAGGVDVFVTKFNDTGGQLIYSTYLGGSGDDWNYGMAIDSSGNVYLMGDTKSTDFPTENPYQANHAGGTYDVFVTKLNAAGDALLYSTYLGGSDRDLGSASASGIVLDTLENAYVTGETRSTDFPTKDPYQATNAGNYDCFVAKFDIAPPKVTSTSPADGATDVAVNTSISATFSEPVDASSISTSSFYLSGGISGTVSYDPDTRTATFTPSGYLECDCTYTVTITTDVKDTADNYMYSDYTWSFTTASTSDLASPTVVSVSPPDGAVNVATGTSVSALFSEPLDSTSVNTSTFILKGSDGKVISGTVSYEEDNNLARFTPEAPLSYSTLYTASLTTGIKDVAGNTLESSYTWSFTTASQDTQTNLVTNPEGDGTIILYISAGALASVEGVKISYCANPPESYSFPYGLLDVKITGLETGQSVTLSIVLPDKILSHARWYWYNPNYVLWSDITMYTKWSGQTAMVTLKDGGLGDSDGEANGVILDPIGMALGQVVEKEAAGRCYIATAVYGEAHPHVQVLEDFRDTFLLTTPFGQVFVAGYERVSPGLASYVGSRGLISVARSVADVVVCVLYPGIWVLISGIMVVIVLGCKFRLWRSGPSGDRN
jgi:hypothetical protein